MRTTNRASRRTPRRLSSRNAKTPTNETSRPDEHEGRESTHAYDRKTANARQDQTPRQLNGRKQKPHADTPKTTKVTTKTPRQAERHNRVCPGETDPKTHNAGALCTSRLLIAVLRERERYCNMAGAMRRDRLVTDGRR